VRTLRTFTKKDPEWGMPLAKIVWEVYALASNNDIYHYDIDHTVRKTILKGQQQLNDDVLLVSFTKKLYVDGLPALIRLFFYRLRTRTNPSVFSGNYWINKKVFFDLVHEDEYKTIRNGIDTFIIEKVQNSKYKMIMNKEIGVNAMSMQNEDYDWRQFLDGIWFYANHQNIKEGKIKTGVIRTGLFMKHPKFSVYVKSFCYQRFGILRGYKWAERNPQSEQVNRARDVDYAGWSYFGNKFLPKDEKFKDTGTGHDVYHEEKKE
jgi:hypothetical protein